MRKLSNNSLVPSIKDTQKAGKRASVDLAAGSHGLKISSRHPALLYHRITESPELKGPTG